MAWGKAGTAIVSTICCVTIASSIKCLWHYWWVCLGVWGDKCHSGLRSPWDKNWTYSQSINMRKLRAQQFKPYLCCVQSSKTGEHACESFSFNSPGGCSNNHSYQATPAHTHQTYVRCTAPEIFTSIHKTAALPLPLSEHFSFPLKEMRKKEAILGRGNSAKRSEATLICRFDRGRVRIQQEIKEKRLEKTSDFLKVAVQMEKQKDQDVSVLKEGKESSYGKDVRLWQECCLWPSWIMLDTFIRMTTRSTRTFLYFEDDSFRLERLCFSDRKTLNTTSSTHCWSYWF